MNYQNVGMWFTANRIPQGFIWIGYLLETYGAIFEANCRFVLCLTQTGRVARQPHPVFVFRHGGAGAQTVVF